MLKLKLYSLFVLLANIQLASANVNVDDFSCAFPISDGESSVRTFNLSLDAISCTENYYSDMIIINADNQIVPFKFRPKQLTRESKITDRSIEFSIAAESDIYNRKELITLYSSLTGFYINDVEFDEIDLNNMSFSSIVFESLSDTESLDSISVLSSDNDSTNIAAILIDGSNDLQKWTRISNPIKLTYPALNSSEIEKKLSNNTVNLNSKNIPKYLRAAILSFNRDFKIDELTGSYHAYEQTKPNINWLTVNASQVKGKKNEWLLSLPYELPITHLKMTPSGSIVFYQGKLYAAPSNAENSHNYSKRNINKEKIKRVIKNSLLYNNPNFDNNWNYVTYFNQYKLNSESRTLNREPIRINNVSSREFLIIFDEPKELSNSQLPIIELGWQAPEVEFLAQGAPPYKLLVGSRNKDAKVLRSSNYPRLTETINMIETVELQKKNIKTQIKDTYITPDESHTKEHLIQNKFLLWGILLSGILLLAFMAYKLGKDIKYLK